MPSAPPVLRSLDRIVTEYAVFEKDQVLTHDQLNTLSGYADDQVRLTRVRLLGVGVIGGLRVSSSGTTVTVTRGVGITTDGDLLYLDQDTTYAAYRDYDGTFPAYPPLYEGGDVQGRKFAAWELLPAVATAATDHPLGELATRAERTLDSLAVAFIMESYCKTDDLCTGTDCDNKGAEAINTPRMLLLESAALAGLRESVATPADAFPLLPEIAADRAALPPTLASVNDLSQAYRSACDSIVGKLVAALQQLPASCGAFLPDLATSAVISAWTGQLLQHRKMAVELTRTTQYFYDFLKDLVDAYNEFREHLFGDNTWCVPAIGTFPKHLLLGNLASAGDPAADRTGFYPSPLTGRSADEQEHARFLLARLGTLIGTFKVNATAGRPIRVTPSAGEERPLGERAIPCYYAPDPGDPVHKRWSWRLSRQGREASSYAYNATAWGAQGAAADPLLFQIGRFPCFRVEGHVGTDVATALAAIEKEIGEHNLPFIVRSVLLGTEPAKLVKRPGIHYTDLHRLHYVLRQDAVRRLDETTQFSGNFKAQVHEAVTSGRIPDLPSENEGVQLRDVADQKDTTVSTRAAAAKTKLNRDYASYAADVSWSDDLTETVRAAGEFKYNLSPVAKTEFNTPFDTLIGSTHLDWLPWLDQLLGRKEAKEDSKLLFSSFAGEHPQIEHMAGVPRGGTFVLLYDTGGTVVGDVMLPYYCPEPPREEPDEPPLVHPGFRPPFVLDNGVHILPSRTTFVGQKMNDLQEKINATIDVQGKYFDALRNSYVSALTDTVQVVKGEQTGAKVVNPAFADPVLSALVEEQKATERRLDATREAAQKPDATPEEKATYQEQASAAEKDVAVAAQRTAEYVATSGKDVSFGSEGYSALAQVSTGLSKVTDTATKTATRTAITEMSGATESFRQAASFMIR